MNTRMNKTITMILALLLALGCFGVPSVVNADCDSDLYEEAIKETEDEWKALRETMQQSSTKLDEIKKQYQEYEDAAFSSNPEKGVDLAVKLFNLTPDQRSQAMDKVWSIREMFNKLDKNGLKTKLESVSERLKFADNVAGEVEGVWDFAKKFNPANAKENPTYGLRLIGDLITEGAGKIKAVPLVGEILGSWLEAYGEAATDYANALDRLSEKIKKFRQESLCGQSGMWTDQQKAFDEAAKLSGESESCQTYFATGQFVRMRTGMAFAGNTTYFLFDIRTCRGYIATKWKVDQVYEWHEQLLKRRALDPDWLSSRANSLKREQINTAEGYHTLFSGWANKSHNGWLIIEKLGHTETVNRYGTLAQTTFVGNFILDDEIHADIQRVIDDYEKHVYVEGTITGRAKDGEEPLSGASIVFTVSGKTYSATSGSNGQYGILMQAKLDERYDLSITAQDYEDYKTSSTIYERAMIGYDFTLNKKGETKTFTISGMVSDSTDGSLLPANGATVTVAASAAASLGSTVTGADGSYVLVVQVQDNAALSVTATKEGATGGNSVVASGDAAANVNITLGSTATEETATGWTVTVTVIDNNGAPLGGAAVVSGTLSAVTGADGIAVLGPMDVTSDPFTISISASIQAEGGVTVNSSEASLTYAGEANSAISLAIPVVIPTSVTITGTVRDINGVGVDGATVTGGGQSVATAGGGAFSMGPLLLVKDSTVTLTPSYTDGTNSFGGAAVSVTFTGAGTALQANLTLDLEMDLDVTITGLVHDVNGVPIPGVAVTSGTAATATDGGGSYTLPAITCTLGKPLTISASFTDHTGASTSAVTSVTPTQASVNAPTIVLNVVTEEHLLANISGMVVDQDGNGVAGASVSAGGLSTSTDGSGGYSLGEVEYPEGSSVTISASATSADGSTVSNSVSITPASEYETAPTLVLNLGDDDENDGDEDIDDAIDDLEDDNVTGGDRDAIMAEFEMLIATLDGINADFFSYHSRVMVILRAEREFVCSNGDVPYLLNQAEFSADNYTLNLAGLAGIYGELVAAYVDEPGSADLAIAQAEYDRVVNEELTITSSYADMVSGYTEFQCDEDDSNPDAEDNAEDGQDPDDAIYGVEVCGDGIDNDGDNEIDECDAGCCDKNVQVIVSDCGNAADDIFSVAIDGQDVGLTPKGAANTFNIELSPGAHSVAITCLDDGGNPPGSDIGTACVTIIIFGNETIGGAGVDVAYGGTANVGFTVPAGDTAPPFNKIIDGSHLPLEGIRR